MGEIKLVEIKQSIFEKNENMADELRAELNAKGVYMINLMSSPGAGKTTTLLRLIEMLKDEFAIGVMEADIDATVDAEKIAASGAKSIQLHTGGMCHMDAYMTKQGLDEFGTDGLDIIFLENVGNLVCPAEFDTGATKNMMILSVPEGDDKPLKYPLMFQVSDLVLINKTDVKSVFDFDEELAKKRILQRNPKAEIISVSAKTGEGFEAFADWLRREIKEYRNV